MEFWLYTTNSSSIPFVLTVVGILKETSTRFDGILLVSISQAQEMLSSLSLKDNSIGRQMY